MPFPVFFPCFLCFRKLRATLDEYTTRVGQQAIVLCISPSKPNPVFKVFGAAPLENVVGVPKKAGKNFLTFSADSLLLKAALESWQGSEGHVKNPGKQSLGFVECRAGGVSGFRDLFQP